MPRPLDELPLVLQKYRKAIGPAVNRVAREAARQGGAELAADTAVDTGQARSNWVMTLDTPFEEEIEAYAPIPRLGYSDPTRKLETANLSHVEAQHASASQAFDVERNRSIHVRNNWEHIGEMEAGTLSPQTDAGMLRRGLEAAIKACVGRWKITGAP
jgi:hypothetical protein